ncbi:nitric oxide dioxygenase [Chromohalobacter marismortui]|uniref:Flavohemoprotein n=1 Tax=Chromohalobacter marismortui TaxID=42055 RepID=A0A4V3F2W4_9GAMM|nr:MULTISPECIES: NO-inducible flavohemoprotein [Chromohalobacter]MCI0511079.1 NO-inducible flavohemoprotein [Chromohalobacter sp.]MCI0593183.1 NO-inducible flavohemoprotein [Chromohalobacter sp.]TDU19106.1 nitric oxide dioxygenase [Chromohalobacter marismortui]
MLTSAQEAVIAATTPVVAEHIEAIAKRFYPLMFARYPEVKTLFNAAHQQSGGQPRALAGAVVAYVQLRHEPARLDEVLGIVVDKHVSLGIRPEHYPIVGECLMAAIGEELGKAVTEEVADAWGALYEELAGLLIEKEARRYQDFAAQPGGWEGTREFRIAAKRPESAVITSFELAPVDGGVVAMHRPGQYIGLKLVIDGETVHRHYSLSAAPNGRTYRISIKREEGGQVSRHFHDRLAVGDTLELLPPAGHLTLAAGDAPVMLISGGVGQTPMLPLARQALAEGRRVVYLHAAHDGAVHAFADELADLHQAYPGLLRVITVYSQPRLEDAPDHIGHVNAALLADYVPRDAQCYTVGPAAFMRCVEAALETLGVAAERRHHEFFGPAESLARVA